jgi:hypothetical protein
LSVPVKGVPALAIHKYLKIKNLHVLTISTEPSGFLTNQVHPDPKFETQFLVKASLNASKEPHFMIIN